MRRFRLLRTQRERLVFRAFLVVVFGGIVVAAVAGSDGGTPTPGPTATAQADVPPCDPHRLHLKVDSWDSDFPGTSGQRVIALHLTRIDAPTCRIYSPIELELREEPGHASASWIRGNPMTCLVHRQIKPRGVLVIWSLVGNVAPGARLQINAKVDGQAASGFTQRPGGYGNSGYGPGAELQVGAPGYGRRHPAPKRCLSRRA